MNVTKKRKKTALEIINDKTLSFNKKWNLLLEDHSLGAIKTSK